MEFEYTLTKEEYLDFCKYQTLGEPAFQKLRHRCWFILPVGVVLLIAVLLISSVPVPWWGYMVAVAASLLWVLLVNRLVAGAMVKSAKQRCDQAGEEAFRPVKVSLTEGRLKVNGGRKELVNYRFFSNLILLFLMDGSCVVLPQRVFGESKEELRRVVAQLDRCLGK